MDDNIQICENCGATIIIHIFSTFPLQCGECGHIQRPKSYSYWKTIPLKFE